MFKYLFFDDVLLNGRENVTRSYGIAELEEIYYDGILSTTIPSSFIVKTDDGRYAMIYQGFTKDNKIFASIAMSDDGVHFTPFNTENLIDIDDRKAPNELMDLTGCEIAYLLRDDINDSDERYKMLIARADSPNWRMIDEIYTSPDLIHWTLLEGAHWNGGAEPPVGVFYNKVKECFTIMTRPYWGMRMVGYVETKDWRTFTPYSICLRSDSLDGPLEEFYGMGAFEYDGWYIGFPFMYGSMPSGTASKFEGGKVRPQIAYSKDGNHWQRSLRTPFIDGTRADIIEKTGHEICMLWPNNITVSEDGSINLFAAACRFEHGSGFRKPDGGTIHRYKLRKDGFIMLKPEDLTMPALIATRENIWHGGELHVNIKCKNATVAVYESKGADNPEGHSFVIDGYGHEDCIAFSGDSSDWIVKFKDGKDLNSLKGKTLVFEIKFTDGELYSLHGDFTPTLNIPGVRYRTHGIMPDFLI